MEQLDVQLNYSSAVLHVDCLIVLRLRVVSLLPSLRTSRTLTHATIHSTATMMASAMDDVLVPHADLCIAYDSEHLLFLVCCSF
jgi:hypothetical protein